MKNKLGVLSVWLFLGMLALTVFGCSGASTPAGPAPSTAAPSDDEALTAINNSGLFSGGAEKYVLKAPIEIMQRGNQNSDGSWSMKVRITFTSTAHGHESKLMEKTPAFRIYQSKNSSGNIVWKAVVGS